MSKYDDLKEKVFDAIAMNHSQLVALNDDLADHPEISAQEYESSRKIVELLRGKGYVVEYPYAGLDTAFKAVFGKNDHKRKIVVMTEYDALPEVGHACGHCTSAAISLLTGLALKDLQDELDADVHIIGTPIEETDGAKCTMVKKGVFDGYDMAMMLHLYNCNLLAPRLLALDSYMYKFYGKAAHASAAPWDGINALNAAQLMFHGVDMLRQHVKPDVRMHGIIRDGGAAPNIVPEYVAAEFYVRALERDYLDEIVSKVDDCAKGAAIATQTTFEKLPTAEAYDNLKNNEPGLKVLEETFAELGIALNGNTEETFGSSDAGNVSMVCPTFHPTLEIVDADVAIHTRSFADGVKTERAHKAISDGAKLLALHTVKIFTDEAKFKAMKDDFLRGK